jgi:hypothetical protein
MSIGDLQRTRRGWVVTAPSECPAGHPIGPGRGVLVGYMPCAGPFKNGHLTWSCPCGETVYAPALGPECALLHGAAAVRNV